jgi:hypothetical protein
LHTTSGAFVRTDYTRLQMRFNVMGALRTPSPVSRDSQATDRQQGKSEYPGFALLRQLAHGVSTAAITMPWSRIYPRGEALRTGLKPGRRCFSPARAG